MTNKPASPQEWPKAEEAARNAVHRWIRLRLDTGGKMLIGYHAKELIDEITAVMEAREQILRTPAGVDEGVIAEIEKRHEQVSQLDLGTHYYLLNEAHQDRATLLRLLNQLTNRTSKS